MTSGRGVVWFAVVMVAVLCTVGCPKKSRGPGEEEGIGPGMEEEAVGGAGRGTLAHEQAGIPPERREAGPLKDIHFAFDSFELTDTARRILQENAEWLNDHRGARVELEGHCDERGTVEYNLALGAKRAAAAKAYLVSLGVAPERITTISYGEELPLCTEKTEACWERNRRAHFVVMGK